MIVFEYVSLYEFLIWDKSVFVKCYYDNLELSDSYILKVLYKMNFGFRIKND